MGLRSSTLSHPGTKALDARSTLDIHLGLLLQKGQTAFSLAFEAGPAADVGSGQPRTVAAATCVAIVRS